MACGGLAGVRGLTVFLGYSGSLPSTHGAQRALLAGELAFGRAVSRLALGFSWGSKPTLNAGCWFASCANPTHIAVRLRHEMGQRTANPTKNKGIKNPQTGELPGIALSPGASCTSLESSGSGGTHATNQPHSPPPCYSLPLPVAGWRMRHQSRCSSTQYSGNRHSGNHHPGNNRLYG